MILIKMNRECKRSLSITDEQNSRDYRSKKPHHWIQNVVFEVENKKPVLFVLERNFLDDRKSA